MLKRFAVLFSEDGTELFRGNPAEVPVRFGTDSNIIEVSMSNVIDAGIPIDTESGDDIPLYEEEID